MDHDHDHVHHHHAADMVSSTVATTLMNHAHHMMEHKSNTTSVPSGHGSHADHMMSMAMTFHGGFTEQILFSQWNTKTASAFIGSWIIIFLVAVLYEGLKTIRDQLAKREARCKCEEQGERPSSLARLLSLHHIIQTLLHILQMGISYLLMLVAMTFNIYLFLAVILGAGVGHFLFGWRRSSVIDYNDHCH
ncbi:unnamed protein product [Rotaria socialis]|uniref:Copper transport protein n=1 Tax=Rotaria socialis TaxID=392032 RepID=A0A818BY95_9BILA|nr:unnamed protein product [Rotaria socialis]CAF3422375.1 unnamed protein product [Rotaria socialis]CAF3665562.1 unnamed protein product [Rotaria socialis]